MKTKRKKKMAKSTLLSKILGFANADDKNYKQLEKIVKEVARNNEINLRNRKSA
jgi:hypothetical protein